MTRRITRRKVVMTTAVLVPLILFLSAKPKLKVSLDGGEGTGRRFSVRFP